MAPLVTDDDLYLFNEGSHFHLFDKLGAHVRPEGTHFAVWAPNAERVSLVTDGNGWSRDAQPLSTVGGSGIWATFVEGIGQGHLYKYAILDRQGRWHEKADPVGFHHETPPKTASIAWPLDYEWGDDAWMQERAKRNGRDAPISIYEVHLGSWRRHMEQGARSLSYAELATELADHCERCGFTHVELLPVMEHPFEGSWGYQVTGFFAPTSRWGTPQELMHLVDTLHQRGIGVILDWVPAHFPTDAHGLGYFDGTHLYEHEDPRQGFHPDWTTFIFNYGRHEVRSFLISSASFWIERYHVDGIRVDGVASMLYRDYSREHGEWIPNEHGGRENLEAIGLLRKLNEHLYGMYPGIQTYAEESTSWPGVSKPTTEGGLGFGLKWDMGWMHDTLQYLSREPVHRQYHHDELTFRSLYAFSESFVLPLSHDEVVHGKGSLIGKMPGDDWQQFANLRLLYGAMWATPGKKLLFMGGELAQRAEWDHDGSVHWHLREAGAHEGITELVGRLNATYREEPALHEQDLDPAGFRWVSADDRAQSVTAFLRLAKDGSPVLVVCNYTPVPRHGYQIGVPVAGRWEEILNTDAPAYGGSGIGNLGSVLASEEPCHDFPCSVWLTLPPLAVVYLRPER